MDKSMQTPLTVLAATTLTTMVAAAWLTAVTAAMISPAGLVSGRSRNPQPKRA